MQRAQYLCAAAWPGGGGGVSARCGYLLAVTEHRQSSASIDISALRLTRAGLSPALSDPAGLQEQLLTRLELRVNTAVAKVGVRYDVA